MELYDAEVAWFAAATEMSAETPLYDLKRAYYAAQTELSPEMPLYDLERVYFAARTGLDVTTPREDLEVAFLAQERELPLTTPLDDLRRAYYGPGELPLIEISDGSVEAGAETADGAWWANVASGTGSCLYGTAGNPESQGGELEFSDSVVLYEFVDLEPETEYFYTLRLQAEGYADFELASSFVTTAL